MLYMHVYHQDIISPMISYSHVLSKQDSVRKKKKEYHRKLEIHPIVFF